MIPETCSYCLKRPAKSVCLDGAPICDHCAEPGVPATALINAALDAHDVALSAQMRMRRLAHERDEAIRVALESGVSAIQLAEKLGITRQRIHTMARNAKEQP